MHMLNNEDQKIADFKLAFAKIEEQGYGGGFTSQNKQWYESSISCDAPKIDDIVKKCIDDLWVKYDTDDSGYLDRQETFVFIKDSLQGERNHDEEHDIIDGEP